MRYDNKQTKTTTDQNELVKKRDRNIIRHYRSGDKLKHLNDRQIARLSLVSHVWKQTDTFYKVSNDVYDNPDYWWIVAWFNKTPTEFHLDSGDVIHVPTPLETVLSMMEV